MPRKTRSGQSERTREQREVEQALGYEFKDPGLVTQALTHASIRSSAPERIDNERLEFLGDRVLGLAVARLLLERFGEAREGELARRFNRLVRRETCAEVAQRLGLGPLVILSESESTSGGRAKSTILGDACEAVLGAIFLDGGFDAVEPIVRRHWGPLVGEAEEVAPDAKSALQEWAQGRGLALPGYVEVGRKGPDHAPLFTTEVRIKGLKPARGTGSSKRIAEQAAASALLRREGVWASDEDQGHAAG